MDVEEIYRIYKMHPAVQTDTRKLAAGDLFFALKGPSFNGNQFATKAIEMGAAYAVIDDPSYAIPGRTILVPDVLEALQQLALHHRRQLDIPFIAITGSNGKTTTKELIHAVLSTTYRTYTTEGNLNNHIGVPLTILKIKDDAQMAVIEMGANHQKEIEFYCTIALPTHGLITNCGKAHLEGFGGEEGVRKGKGELYDHLRKQGGTALVMWDYDYLRDMSRGIPVIVTYGTSNADVEGQTDQSSQYLSVRFNKGLETTIQTQLVGDYNLPNVLAAAAVGRLFHIEEEKIREAIESYQPTNSRSQFMKKGSNRIILDAYNANPSSMKAAIQNFVKAEGDNKVLAIGGMAELGGTSIKEHQSIVDEIKKHHWKEVILVGGDFLKTEHPFRSFQTPEEAGRWIKEQEWKDAYLLIKGSRSMQMEKLLEFL